MRRLANPRAVFPNHPRGKLNCDRIRTVESRSDLLSTVQKKLRGKCGALFDIIAAFLRGEIRTDGRLGMPSRPKLISASTRTSRSTEILQHFMEYATSKSVLSPDQSRRPPRHDEGWQAANRKGRAAMTRKTYCGNLLWQSSLILLVPKL